MTAKEFFAICDQAEELPANKTFDGMTFVEELSLMYCKTTIYQDNSGKYWKEVKVL